MSTLTTGPDPATRKKKIHVFASDLLPFPGCARSAGGNRSMQIISALRNAGHQVTFSMCLTSYLAKKSWDVVIAQLSAEELWCCEHYFEPEVVLARVQPDIAIYCNVNTFRTVGRYNRDIVQVLDFYGPVHLEGFLIQAEDPVEAMQDGAILESNCFEMVERFRHVDQVVTVSERQKYFWSAYCSLAGFSFNDLGVLVCPVSFHVPSVTRKTAPDLTVVYSGGFYPWQNPDRFLRAAAVMLDDIPGAKLQIFGGPHSGLPNEPEVYRMLEELQQHRCVEYRGYRPVEELIDALSSAWCALEVMEQNIERELAITGRTVEFLSTGTPVIYNNYSTLSSLIEKYNAGWTVGPGHTEPLGDIFNELLAGGPALVQQLSCNARNLATQEFNTEKNTAPLVEFCNGEVRKRGTVPHSSATHTRNGKDKHSEKMMAGENRSIGKVLVVSPAAEGHVLLELRLANPLRALQRQGFISGFTHGGLWLERLNNDQSYYDAVVIQRCVPAQIYQAFTNVGLPFLLEVDDNLLARAAYRSEPVERGIVVGLEQATALSCPNPRLVRMLEKYSGVRLAAKAFMTPNALPYPETGVRPGPPEQIIWIQSDIAALTTSRSNVIRAVEEFSCRHRLPVVLIGKNVLERPMFTHQVVMGEIDFSSNLQLLQFSPPSIGVAPLETVSDEQTLDFISGKSDLKMLLFNGYGHPGVYSTSAPYSDSPLQAHAIVVDNSHEAWLNALEYAYREGWRDAPQQAEAIRELRHVDRVARESWLPALRECLFQKPVRGAELYETLASFREVNASALSSMAYALANPDVQQNCLEISDVFHRGWDHYSAMGRHEHDRTVQHKWQAHRELVDNLETQSAGLFANAVPRLAAHSSEIQQLQNTIREQEVRTAELRATYDRRIADLQTQVTDIHRSYSWRFTGPLRTLARPVMEPKLK